MDGADYEQVTVDLDPGDVVLGYTDGITEARAPDGEFFGEERLFQLLSETRDSSADEILARLFEAVETYTGGAEPTDDITAVVIRRADADPVPEDETAAPGSDEPADDAGPAENATDKDGMS